MKSLEALAQPLQDGLRAVLYSGTRTDHIIGTSTGTGANTAAADKNTAW